MTAIVTAGARLDLTRDQIVAFRLRANALVERGILAESPAHPGKLVFLKRDAPVQVPASVEVLVATQPNWPLAFTVEAVFGGTVLGTGTGHNKKMAEQQAAKLIFDRIIPAGREPGFLLSSGCALGRDTPPANVEAMAEAVK